MTGDDKRILSHDDYKRPFHFRIRKQGYGRNQTLLATPRMYAAVTGFLRNRNANGSQPQNVLKPRVAM